MNERDESLRQIEREVTALIRRVKRVVGDRARVIHPDLGPAGYFMLLHLATAGPVRAADLAEALGHDKGGVSRHVQHLADLGLLERQPDPEDRRAQLLVITEQGHARLEAMHDERRKRFDARLSEWSADELADFARQLGRYNAALEVD